MIRKLIVALPLLAVVHSAVSAADIEVTKLGEKTTAILVSGDLVYGDEKKFVDAALAKPDAVVILASDGGNLIAGIEIGKAIRLKGFSTFVPDDFRCASACALAWLGGTHRAMGEGSHVGFHAASMGDTGAVTSSGNALIGAYLNQLGLPASAIVYITEASPGEIRWLSEADARQHGIEVSLLPSSPGAVKQKGPASTTPPTAVADPVSARARKVAQTFYNVSSSADAVVLNYLSTAYDSEVTYYGKKTSKASILKDKLSFFRRWPIRQYRVDEQSLVVSCNDLVCSVSGNASWSMAAPQRNAVSDGVARFSLTITTSEIPKIVAEQSSVVSRNVQPSSSTPQPTSANQMVYLFDVLKNRPGYKRTWEAILSSPKGRLPRWLALGAPTYNFVAMPMRTIRLERMTFEAFVVCQPHNCGGNELVLFFTPGGTGAWGLVQENGKPAAWLGSSVPALVKPLLSTLNSENYKGDGT
jgi:hypothetical protein